jgi:IS5 family transposase
MAVRLMATAWGGHRRAGTTNRVETRRIHVDKGYRGHNHPQKFRVWMSGQVRWATAQICRNMKRRGTVEPIIGHLKVVHHMGRNHPTGRDGDRANAVLAAVALLLRWLARLLRALFRFLLPPFIGAPNPT